MEFHGVVCHFLSTFSNFIPVLRTVLSLSPITCANLENDEGSLGVLLDPSVALELETKSGQNVPRTFAGITRILNFPH